MKKLIVLFLTFSLALCLGACDKANSIDKEDRYNVELAISALELHWKDRYAQSENADGHFEILHTRVLEIDSKKGDKFSSIIENGENIEYIIEFELYTDHFSAAPYYVNTKLDVLAGYKNALPKVQPHK